MNRLVPIILLLLLPWRVAQAQFSPPEAESEPFSTTVLELDAQAFPTVVLRFRAWGPRGIPQTQLDTSRMTITEGELRRPILGLAPLAERLPIQIALVVDHSASMVDEFIYAFDTLPGGQLQIKNVALRKPGDPYAIDRAREGVQSFVQSLNPAKDSLLIVGFSGTVDRVPPLTNDTARIRAAVDRLQARGATAFYDALRTGIDSLENYTGLRAVVALTDGVDNASYTSLDSVIRRAQQAQIPVYVIGLGNVDRVILRQLGEETAGGFHYTSDANALTEIYLRISEELRAGYELVFRTGPLRAASEQARAVELRWRTQGEGLKVMRGVYAVPELVIQEMKDRERKVRLLLVGVMVAIAALGVWLLLGGKKSAPPLGPAPVEEELPETLLLPRAFPNPSSGLVYFAFALPDELLVADLFLTDQRGQLLGQYTLSGSKGMLELDLGDLPAGRYRYRLSSGEAISKVGTLSLR